MNVPEKLINFRVYHDGKDFIGTSDVTLPKMDAMTQTIKGAGIAGEMDTPVLGHFKSMEVELNWRTLSENAIVLFQQKGINLDIRGAVQVYNSESGEYITRAVKVVIRGVPKGMEMGKLAMGDAMDTKTTLECDYIKLSIDGSTQIELDKYNYICNIGGTDYLEDVRDALGLN